MDIGSRIEKIRGHLSRKEFGARIGVGKTTIQNYETKNRVPKCSILRNIKKEFNVNIEWLLTGEGTPYRIQDQIIASDELEIKLRGHDGQIKDPEAEYAQATGADSFDRAVTGLKEIYESGDLVLIHAIEANILAFRLATKREKTIKDQGGDEIKNLKKGYKDLKAMLESIEKQLQNFIKGKKQKGNIPPRPPDGVNLAPRKDREARSE
jgi:transcriptional regulator with XRE-family HTH domain